MRKPPLRCPDWGSDRGRKNPRDRGSVLPALVQVNLMRKMWVTGVVTQGEDFYSGLQHRWAPIPVHPGCRAVRR